MSSGTPYGNCSHLDGRCQVPKKKGSQFCQHHCCPGCFKDKSSTATMCNACLKDKVGPSPPRPQAGPASSPLPGAVNFLSPLSIESNQRVDPPQPLGRQSSGLQRLQDAAFRVQQQNQNRKAEGPSLKVSPQDEANLRVMLKRGMLTPERFNSEMARLRQMTSQLFERPINTPKRSGDIVGSSTALIQRNNFELAYRYSYDYPSRKWDRSVVVVSIESTHFSEGNLRRCFRMKDLTKPDGENDFVAKASKDKNDDIEIYFLDIEMQAMCQAFAEEYNRRRPPKKVEFIEAFLVECFQRRENQIFACEPYIKGQYVKYSNNWGFVSPHDRNTPHAFSHFTYVMSDKKYIVVDVQGVNDKYTDPQVHSFDGVGFGKGNCGSEGIQKFFSTHKCNVLCKMLGLTSQVHTLSGTMAPGFEKLAPQARQVLYDATPSAADLGFYGLTEQEYRLLVQAFQAVDKDKNGEIDMQELGQLCKVLRLQVSPEHYVSLLETIDRDGSGSVSLPEFLYWWTGHCGAGSG